MLFILLLSLLAGCMNLYVRCPITDNKITQTYQCTKETFALSYVIMFPQVLPPGKNDKTLYLANIITIPVGCICFVDVACEAVVDTIFWPIDVQLAKRINK